MYYRSGAELVQRHHDSHTNDVPVISRGMKKKFPAAKHDLVYEEEQQAINSLQNDLHKMLNQERIERTVTRSQAIYITDSNDVPALIRLSRKMGKWNLFGYTIDNVQYLHAHEALYLMEMNRLELYYDSVSISLEQAYALLLGTNISAEAYFVYAQLMRTGFILELHNKENDNKSTGCENLTDADAAVWYCLFNMLESQPAKNVSAEMSNKSNSLYLKTQQSMLDIADKIKSPSAAGFDTECADEATSSKCVTDPWNCNISRKRKAPPSDKSESESKSAWKKIKFSNEEYRAEPYLDAISDDADVILQFRNIFKEIEIIKLTTVHAEVNSVDDALKFDFDLFPANSNYRKSEPGQPLYRVLVMTGQYSPPTRQAIVECYSRQSFRAPILVIIVNETMAMQAFVYKFSV